MINIDELNESGIKKVALCVCMDTNKDMIQVLDPKIVEATKKLIEKKKDNPKIHKFYENRLIKLRDAVDLFYDDYPEDIKKEYPTKASMLQSKNAAVQSKEVLEMLFESLRTTRDPNIDVEVCVVTFANGNAETLIDFIGPDKWDNDDWIKELDKIKISYTGIKTALVGLSRATKELENRNKYYEENKISHYKGRLVLFTRSTNTEEDDLDRAFMRMEVLDQLGSFRNIPVILGKGEKQEQYELGDIAFPPTTTQFINADDSRSRLEEVFSKIAVSVSSNTDTVMDVNDTYIPLDC